MNGEMRRFILSIRPNGSRPSKESLAEIANTVCRLIRDPEAKVVTLERLSLLLLSCRCQDKEEVKRRIASCKSVEKVLDDFGIALPAAKEDPPLTSS